MVKKKKGGRERGDFFFLAGLIFGFVAIMQIFLSFDSLPLTIGEVRVPLWISYVAVFISGIMTYWSFRFLINERKN